MSAQTEVLYIDVRARHCVAEVFFNGVPASRLGEGRALRASIPVLHHTVGGSNRLEVVVEPRVIASLDDAAILHEERKNESSSPPMVLARLTWFRDGTFADSDTEGRTMGEVLVYGHDAWKTRHVAEIDLGLTDARPAWADADVLSVTNELLDEAGSELERLREAIERGDAATVERITEPFIDDYARAYPEMGRAGLSLTHRRWLEAFVLAKGRAEIADRATWQPRLLAGGKLLDLRKKNGEPVMTLFEDGAPPLGYPALFAKRGASQWVLR